MSWRDEKIDRIIKQLARQEGLSELQALDIIESVFKTLKTHLQSDDMPRVLINGFGSFAPSPGSLKRRIRVMQEKGRDTSHLEEILQRLEDEKESRKHKRTKKG